MQRLVGSVEKRSLLQTKVDFMEEKQKQVNQVLRQVLPLLVNFNPRKQDTFELLLEVDAIPEGLPDAVVLDLGAPLTHLPPPKFQLDYSSLTSSWHQSHPKYEVLVWRIGFKIHIALFDQVFTARLQN